ncbi:MAG: carbamoyltransferase HypF [Desulfocucumaceae bacterium]
MKGAILSSSLVVTGTVQGVGFRPFVYMLAQKHGLKGSVGNTGRGVEIIVEGSPGAVEGFIVELKESPPPLARIAGVKICSRPVLGYSAFSINKSTGEAGGDYTVPPDIALCEDCSVEIADPSDRRYGYPFTNCTNCGPRYTIVKDLPYDRHSTSMCEFEMCEKCASEYKSPTDRRFHAQPVACPECGPEIRLTDSAGVDRPGWLAGANRLLMAGKILAIKGLGGFHLACDARRGDVLAELRRRKNRPAKPFAIMCSDLDTIERYCLVGKAEREMLMSPAAPIVILRRKLSCSLPEALAPGMSSLGVMLPYTPMHRLLLSGGLDTLVMTSGNATGLPLEKDNEGALLRLSGIADFFILHNRKIVNRCDDSVAAAAGGEKFLMRRSRGYVPGPVEVPASENSPVVLAVGSEMKNTFCILKGGLAYLGPHLGEIDLLEGQDNFFNTLEGFQRMINASPSVVAYDLHPQYYSSRIGREMPAVLKIAVQHHHAHMASCMAENGLEGEAVGVILDGTGYGEDGASWGFEILKGGYSGFKRLFHQAYVPLPGGDRAIRLPWITAAAYLISMLGSPGEKAARELFGFYGEEYLFVEKMIRSGFNCPTHGGCGRLFDAVAAITGICLANTYEGEAAIRLGEMVREKVDSGSGDLESPPYPFSIEENIINPGPALEKMVADRRSGLPARHIAYGFHRSLVKAIIDVLELAAGRGEGKRVVLSGGCWQNSFLLVKTVKALEERGFEVYRHRLVPSNDGGISLGQSVVALARAKELNCSVESRQLS